MDLILSTIKLAHTAILQVRSSSHLRQNLMLLNVLTSPNWKKFWTATEIKHANQTRHTAHLDFLRLGMLFVTLLCHDSWEHGQITFLLMRQAYNLNARNTCSGSEWSCMNDTKLEVQMQKSFHFSTPQVPTTPVCSCLFQVPMKGFKL